jgi:hypothetical protein
MDCAQALSEIFDILVSAETAEALRIASSGNARKIWAQVAK